MNLAEALKALQENPGKSARLVDIDGAADERCIEVRERQEGLWFAYAGISETREDACLSDLFADHELTSELWVVT